MIYYHGTLVHTQFNADNNNKIVKKFSRFFHILKDHELAAQIVPTNEKENIKDIKTKSGLPNTYKILIIYGYKWYLFYNNLSVYEYIFQNLGVLDIIIFVW